MPVTTVTPLFTSPPPSSGNCFSRFCDKLFGTRYATNYYSAPVTIYRPVTTVNPMTGAPVIVQQPCTSFEQQVQRTPYTSLQFGSPSVVPTAPAAPACAAPCESPATFSQAPAFGSAAPGAIGQVGMTGSPGGAASIPTIAPPSDSSFPSSQPNQTYGQTTYGQTTYGPSSSAAPNTSPMTGTPTIAPPTGNGDLAPVGQPSLQGETAPSVLDNNSAPLSSTVAPPPLWQLQKPEDSTALIPPSVPEPPTTSENGTPIKIAPPILNDDNFTRAEPIEAPADYVAPYRPHSYQSPTILPVNRPISDLPDLQAPVGDDGRLAVGTSQLASVTAQVSTRPSTSPGRVLDLRPRQSVEVTRDTTWTPVSSR
jgi:hypothetical protein